MADTRPVLFDLYQHPLAEKMCDKLPCEAGEISSRAFPDGETYLKVLTAVRDRDCIILADLSQPDGKFLPLVFLSETLQELGARSVGLLAPYLCYMRQDRRFADGEAVTSRIFSNLVSGHFDWLVTVDPHLHRYHSLDEIYSIPSRVVQGAPLLSQWLAGEKNVFLVGPDAESEQWVAKIAGLCGHPFIIGEKQRLGDRQVEIRLPDLAKFTGQTAVIIDDVIASGHTVLECIKSLRANGIASVDCACIHGIFAGHVDRILKTQGLGRLISCNTIVHSSNRLDVSDLLLEPVRQLLGVPKQTYA